MASYLWADLGRLRGLPFPPVNLYESTDGYVLTAEVPGLDTDQLDVSVEGNRVTLRGQRRIEAPGEGVSVHRCERQDGSFRRSVELPAPLDPEKAEASYRNGVLHVRLPKAASHQPRRIEAVVQRFNTERVTSHQQLLFIQVDNTQREHPVQDVEHGLALLFIQVQNHFGVGRGTKLMRLFQLGAQLLEVVDLAVENDPQRTVLIRHRLPARTGQVDDR